MSSHVVSWVLRHSEATLGDRLVLLVLADHAGEDGEDAFPSVARIARSARLDVRSVRRCLRSLEEAGAIRREAVAGPRGTYRYTVHMRAATGDADEPQTGGHSVRGDIVPGGQSMPKRGDTVPPEPTTEPSIAEQQAVQRVEPDELAADIDRLCSLLSDLTRARAETPPSSPRYRVTARWRTEMRRLLTIDNRAAAEVEAAIRWVDRDSFWSSNVMSVPALRRHYDRLRAQATRGRRDGDRLGIERMRKWAEAA